MDWTDGYVADTQYTAGFYREMAPIFMTLAGLMTGGRVPDDERPFSYCELGCGQGVGTAVMAAAAPQGRFYGIDFNPGQIDNARRLARIGGLENVEFIEASFAELLESQFATLPEFDYIALHGVYSWISDDNRRAIVNFIQKKLRPGGAVYVSYNTMPGWAAMAPSRRLMSEVAARQGGRSDLRAVAGLDELDRLKDAGARYFAANPAVAARLTKARALDKAYLAHEYLNANWNPLYVTDVMTELAAAKLTYLGSATLIENLDTIFYPEALRASTTASADAAFVELIKDFYSNKQFRRDIFTRGANRFRPKETLNKLNCLRFALTAAPEDINLSFTTIVGEIKGNENIYRPIINALDGPALSFAAIAALLPQITAGDLFQALYLLTNANQVIPLYRASDSNRISAWRFNSAIIEEARHGRLLPFMAIPDSGLGMPLGMTHLFVLCALGEGLHDVEEIIPRFVALLAENGIRLTQNGIQLTEPGSTELEAKRQIEETLLKHVPIWRRLCILPNEAMGIGS